LTTAVFTLTPFILNSSNVVTPVLSVSKYKRKSVQSPNVFEYVTTFGLVTPLFFVISTCVFPISRLIVTLIVNVPSSSNGVLPEPAKRNQFDNCLEGIVDCLHSLFVVYWVCKLPFIELCNGEPFSGVIYKSEFAIPPPTPNPSS